MVKIPFKTLLISFFEILFKIVHCLLLPLKNLSVVIKSCFFLWLCDTNYIKNKKIFCYLVFNLISKFKIYSSLKKYIMKNLSVPKKEWASWQNEHLTLSHFKKVYLDYPCQIWVTHVLYSKKFAEVYLTSKNMLNLLSWSTDHSQLYNNPRILLKNICKQTLTQITSTIYGLKATCRIVNLFCAITIRFSYLKIQTTCLECPR